MSRCIGCRGLIVGDGTEEMDWSDYCRGCLDSGVDEDSEE